MRERIQENLSLEKKRQTNARELEKIQAINESLRVLQRPLRIFCDDESCRVPRVKRLNSWQE